MSPKLLILVLLPLQAIAAPVPKASKVGDYFPLRIGHTWVYDDGETREVTKWDEQTGAATVKSHFGDSKLTVEKTYLVLADTVLRTLNGPQTYGPSTHELRLPLKPGSTWSWLGRQKENTQSSDDHEAGEPEEVTVPAGTFTAIPVRFKHTGPKGEPRVSTSWYAKDVGLVKSQTVHGVKELKSFTPGKDSKK